MATHCNLYALLDYNDHIVALGETKDRPVTVVNKSPKRGRTNEDGEVNDDMLRQENVAHESDRADADMPIGDRVDIFKNALVARAYANTNKRMRIQWPLRKVNLRSPLDVRQSI